MRRTLSTCSLAVLIAAPLSFIACGDDDDTPPSGTAGTTGDAGDGSGGTAKGGAGAGGGSGARAGAPQGGSGNTGNTGNDAGQGPSAGAGGEPTAGTGSGGTPSEGGSGGTGPGPTACDLSGDGLEREDLPASIEDDLTLTNDRVWVINGEVRVRDGVTLTIPPCTRLEGFSGRSFLAVLRGGKIEAAGTADEPILFTSFEAPGDRAAGDWGGVVILGAAPITGPAGVREAQYEGLTDEDYTYGGDQADDSSGTLSYVRIEYSGYSLSADKEINGLSMAGVGSGTTIDHVMINQTQDDCFEWWGGSVEAEYLICNNPGDDYFDGDEGWQGGGRYWFGRRALTAISSTDPNGFELDSINGGDTPRTNFGFRDVTLCGPGEAFAAYPLIGMVLRELVTGEIDNLALTGFEYGVDTRNAFAAGDVTISNSKFFGLLNPDGVGVSETGDGNDVGFDDASVFTGDTTNELNPDPAPFTVEDCFAEGGPAAAVVDSEIGAFPDADAVSAWKLDGKWVDWSEQ